VGDGGHRQARQCDRSHVEAFHYGATCRTSNSIATRRILSAIWRALRRTAEPPAAAEVVWIKLHGGAVDWTVRSAPRSRRTRERLPAVDHDCLLIAVAITARGLSSHKIRCGPGNETTSIKKDAPISKGPPPGRSRRWPGEDDHLVSVIT